MFEDEVSTRFFILQRHLIQEAKRDPLEGIDRLYIPKTMVHGQSKEMKMKEEIEDPEKKRAAWQSDADDITDDEVTTPPAKPSHQDKDHIPRGFTPPQVS